MRATGWLPDASEASLRSALEVVAPDLARRPITINPRFAQSNQLYWSASAVVDGRFVVKYPWSEVRARRLWREGVILQRLRALDGSLRIPEVVTVSRAPALVATRLIDGAPMSWEWASELGAVAIEHVGHDLAAFLVHLHAVPTSGLLDDLPTVEPTPQADTARLRERFGQFVDSRRADEVETWCRWIDAVLARPKVLPPVVVHGDFHGHNQVWDHGSVRLLAVVDFEETGVAEPEYDLRYLPGNSRTTALTVAVVDGYERLCGTRLDLERIMAWHVLTVLGDALWRTEAGAPLPGGGTPSSWVDDVAARFASFGLLTRRTRRR